MDVYDKAMSDLEPLVAKSSYDMDDQEKGTVRRVTSFLMTDIARSLNRIANAMERDKSA